MPLELFQSSDRKFFRALPQQFPVFWKQPHACVLKVTSVPLKTVRLKQLFGYANLGPCVSSKIGLWADWTAPYIIELWNIVICNKKSREMSCFSTGKGQRTWLKQLSWNTLISCCRFTSQAMESWWQTSPFTRRPSLMILFLRLNRTWSKSSLTTKNITANQTGLQFKREVRVSSTFT